MIVRGSVAGLCGGHNLLAASAIQQLGGASTSEFIIANWAQLIIEA